MIGIGFQEVLVVLVATFLLIGPSRLLELADQLGRWVRALPRRDRPGRYQPFAWLDHRHELPRGAQSVPMSLLATLASWVWALPVSLSVVGILVAVDGSDQQMLGRSAAVLLASLILQASKGALTESPR